MPVKKHNRMPSIFGDLLLDQWPDQWLKRGAMPQINIIETDKKFKIQIAAPGMCKDDFKLELNGDNQLVVCMDKECDKDDKGKECCGEDCDKDEKHHFLRREFGYTSFRQVFNLPDGIDRDKIVAKMKHGVLSIKLPKRPAAEQAHDVKQIAIE